MVSTIGWLIGGTAFATMIVSVVFGIFFLLMSKRLGANLLMYTGFLIICTGLFYLGASVDFLYLIFMGQNIPNESGIHGILSFTSVGPAIIFAMVLGSEILIPEKKKIIVIVFGILAVIFELFLYLDTLNAFVFRNENPGQDLIDSSFVILHPTFLIVAVSLLSALVLCGFGFMIKANQASGELRKKFSFLSIGFILFVICGALDSLVAPGIWLILIRIGMMSYAWLIYFGLKPS
ncbi:MAG: hypothetical protein GF383_04705 [Candidatus Lokiarchaeota archaeon]|nr:hypothetical protein [Candidatus Lokiarchaeota archaeon]MBD3339096.1 hypothetical protein [Candidatus Lokiarchaeota archaeon]